MNTRKLSAPGVVAVLWATVAAAAEPLPLDAFAAPEATRTPVLSPDGRYLAMISHVSGRGVALVRDLKSGGNFAPVVSADANGIFDLQWCYWANASRLLCGLRSAGQQRTFAYSDTKIVLVDPDGKNLKESLRISVAPAARFDAAMVERIANDPQHILARVTLPAVPIPGTTFSGDSVNLYRIDVATGEFKQETLGARLGDQQTDGLGGLRLADGLRRRAGELHVTRNNGEDWHELTKATEFSKSNPLTGLHVAGATGRAFGYALQDGRKALWEFDLEDKAVPKVAFAHAQVDVGDMATADNGAVIGVSYETDRPHAQYVDEKLTAIARAIDKAFPDTFNRIESMSQDRSVLVIAARSDVEAGRYYLYDTASRKLSDLGSAHPGLDGKKLTRMTAVEYAAQDGTKIPAYLTAPSVEQGTKLPLVVLPHSGYEGRARWAFDLMTQFLANRGYAVITMNYRGSTGYGAKWLEAGSRDWGGVVYSDTVDAARWAVSQGIADPRRICIVGQGFSGYTALNAVARDPELFRCAISIGGRAQTTDYPRYVSGLAEGRYFLRTTDANERGEDRDKVVSRLAKDIRIPLLMIHGTEDTRSSFSNSEAMAKALEGEGKQFKLVRIEHADFSFWRESERATLLREVESFLATHLANQPD